MNNSPSRRPALHVTWLNPLYDFVLLCSGLGPSFKRKITGCANLPEVPDGVILDIGAGSGTHAHQLAASYPSMQIIALDPDATIFTKKGDVKNISYQNKPGETTDLPDASVDYIFSTLVFHHLTLAEKRRVLIEIERIIKPNGKFILTDWGRLTAPIFAYYLYVVENKHCIESHFDGRTETLFHELGWHRVVHHRIKLSGIWFSKYLPPSRPKSNCQPDAQ